MKDWITRILLILSPGGVTTVGVSVRTFLFRKRSAADVPAFVGRYLRVLGVIQLIGCNLGGLIFFWCGSEVLKRHARGRTCTLILCGIHLLVVPVVLIALIEPQFRDSRLRIYSSQIEAPAWVTALLLFVMAVVFGLPMALLTLPGVKDLFAGPGRCLKCGYDLRGDLDAGCPECGWGRKS